MEIKQQKRKRIAVESDEESNNSGDSQINDHINEQYNKNNINTIKVMPRAAREAANNRLAEIADIEDDDGDEFNQRLPTKNNHISNTSNNNTKKKTASSTLLSSTSAVIQTHNSNGSDNHKSTKIAKKPIQSKSNPEPTPPSQKAIAEVKRISSRIGDTEWMEADIGQLRLAAVTKSIDKILEMSLSVDNFRLFGNDIIQCFYDVGTVTGEPIRSKTLKYLEFLANRWKYTIMQEGWISNYDGTNTPSPPDIIDCVIGMYCMERVGIRHDVKSELFNFLQNLSKYSAKDFFGWDAKIEMPPDVGYEYIELNNDDNDDDDDVEWGMRRVPISKYRSYSNSLIHSFYADRISLSLNVNYYDIYKWLPTFRPYKGTHELPWTDFIDQCYMVTHIIFTNNNWGELQLHSSLYLHEYTFIRYYFMLFVRNKDMHLLPEFIECLRAFGCDDKDELIRIGMRTILSLQKSNGLWDETESEPYRTYHATMCCAQSLLAHRYRGFGPGIPSISPLLIKWMDEEKNRMADYEVLTNRCKSAKKDKYHNDFLKELRDDNNQENEDDIVDERVLAFKLAVRAVVKVAPKFDGDMVKDSAAGIEITTTMESETSNKVIESSDSVDELSELQRDVEKLASEVSAFIAVDWNLCSNNGEDEGAVKRIEDMRQLLKAANSWVVSASVLKAYPDAIKSLKAISKLQVDSTSEHHTAVEEVVEAALCVINDWKQTIAKQESI